MISEPVVLDAKLVVRGAGNKLSASKTTVRWTAGEGDTVRFTFDGEARPRHQIVKLVWTNLTRGRRARFVCPKSGLACDRLILIDGELASVKGHGLDYRGQTLRHARAAKTMNRLLGADGRGRARGVHRRRLLQKASQQMGDLDITLAMLAAASLGLETVIHEKPKTRAKLAFRCSMADGLRNGRDRFSKAFCSSMLGPQLNDAKALSDATGAGLPPVEGVLQVLEEQPQLDFVAALKDHLVVEGAARSFALCWPDNPGLAFVGAFDLRDPDRGALHLRSPANSFMQTIRIAGRGATARSRRAFLCPVTGRRAEQLYWRENRFASREGQRLVHRSRKWKTPQGERAKDSPCL